MSVLVKVEYLTKVGWAPGHKGIALVSPATYVKTVTTQGVYARCTELDNLLRPTGTVHTSPNLPPYAAKFSTPAPTPSPTASQSVDLCEHCDEFHAAPYDGGCLL